MNWLTNFVRPKLRALVKQRDTPDNLWHKCPGCGQMIFHRDLEANLHVCDKCGHHLRLPALKRLGMLFDEGKYTRIELPKAPVDPLRFRDRKRYTERLKDAQSETSEQDALIVAHGTIGGVPAVVAVFNFDFMAGSMGVAVGESFLGEHEWLELGAHLERAAVGGKGERPQAAGGAWQELRSGRAGAVSHQLLKWTGHET